MTTYRGRLMAESKESRRAQLMGVCLEYLERYCMLIAFTSYLTWPRFDPAAPGHVTFQDWMDSRPELRSVLSRMLRRWASACSSSAEDRTHKCRHRQRGQLGIVLCCGAGSSCRLGRGCGWKRWLGHGRQACVRAQARMGHAGASCRPDRCWFDPLQCCACGYVCRAQGKGMQNPC
eukprot:GHRQ01022416.1.p1 GENE.GHRQ01022416.1~~GHRQ01022416.1.p1  ORF type:complete len:176 (+),score=42.09 GHRQ01022416.1:318-845(+)